MLTTEQHASTVYIDSSCIPQPIVRNAFEFQMANELVSGFKNRHEAACGPDLNSLADPQLPAPSFVTNLLD